MYHRHASLYNVETMQQTISFTMPFLAFMVVGHIGLPKSHQETLTGPHHSVSQQSKRHQDHVSSGQLTI